MAKTTLKEVDVYPENRDPGFDVFSRAADATACLYSDAIRPARLPARGFLFRMSLSPVDHGPDARVVVYDDVDNEVGNVLLPSGIASLDQSVVALLTLDVVHAAVTRLGALRGWDQAVLDAAKNHAIRNGLVHRSTTAWKLGPSREFRARAVRQIGHHGIRQVWVEVERIRDGAIVGLSDPVAVARGWQLHGRHLGWQGIQTVHLASGDEVFPEQSISFELPGGSLHAIQSPFRRPIPALPLTSERPAVVVETPPVATGPRITVRGGSTTRHVPKRYTTALDSLLDLLNEPPWLSWWSGADRDELEVWFDSSGPAGSSPMSLRTGVYARRTKGKLIARIERTFTTPGETGDPADVAHRDFDSLVVLIGKKMNLADPPDMPSRSAVRATVRDVIHVARGRERRIGALLDSIGDRLPADVAVALREWLDDGMTGDCIGALFGQVKAQPIILTDDETRELHALGHAQLYGSGRASADE